MKLLIVSSLVLIVVTSCSDTGKRNKLEINEKEPASNRFLGSLPAYSYLKNPDDTLLFGFSKGTVDYDTSWVLLIYKSKGRIECNYRQLPPNTVTGFDDYLDSSMRLIYYEGFNFELTTQKWDSIIGLSNLEEYKIKDSVFYGGCLHCPRYSAYYKQKTFVNSQLDNDYLIKLDSLLKTELLDRVFEIKRHPKIQIQKGK